LRQHDKTLFILLSPTVWNERMTIFWVACQNAAAAVVLFWINPTIGGGAARALGPKACIRRFELAGALVVRQCGCACLALHHWHGRLAW
jgi:hypothetical protein